MQKNVKVVLTASSTATPSTGKTNTFDYRKGKQIKPTISEVWLGDVNVTDQFDTKYATYGDNNQAGKEMGTITLSPKSGNKNFTGTKTQKFDIKGIDLTGTLKFTVLTKRN